MSGPPHDELRSLPPIDYDRVADVYDLYVPHDFDVPFYLAEAQGARGGVLELMSGTGRVSLPLAEAGVDLTCVDFSAEMLARLEEKLRLRNLKAHVVRSDVRRLDLPRRYDLAFVPFHSFSELVSRRDQESTLEAVRGCLRDGGRLILPLHNPRVRVKSADGVLRLAGGFSDDGGHIVVSGFETLDEGTGIVNRTQFYEFYDAAGNLSAKRILPMRFALIGEEDVGTLAEATGFRQVALYGDYERSEFDPDSSPFAIWVLERTSGSRASGI